MKYIVQFFIRVYQLLLSPFLGTHCRFMPSCSSYASEAFQTHGICAGGWLAIKRLLRCHPFAESKFDPVPAIKLQPSTNH